MIKGDVRRFGRSSVLALGLVASLFLTIAGMIVDWRIATGGIVALLVTAVLCAISIRTRQRHILIVLGIFVFLILGVLEVSVRPVFDVSPAPGIVRRLQQPDLKGLRIGAVDVPLFHMGSKIRSLSGGRLEAMNVPDDVTPSELEQYPVLIVSETYRDGWNSQGYRLEPCGYLFKKWELSDLFTLLRSHDKQVVYDRMKIPYYIAIREKQRKT